MENIDEKKVFPLGVKWVCQSFQSLFLHSLEGCKPSTDDKGLLLK